MNLIVGLRLTLLLFGFEPIEQIGRIHNLCLVSLFTNRLADNRKALLVRKFLVIEFARPNNPDLFTLPSKKSHKAKSSRLSDHPIGQLNRSPHQYSHPNERANQEDGNTGNEIHLSISRSVKPAHVRHQTAGVQH